MTVKNLTNIDLGMLSTIVLGVIVAGVAVKVIDKYVFDKYMPQFSLAPQMPEIVQPEAPQS